MSSHAQARTVVITGASSGIGRACARAFAERGDRLVLVARREQELEKTLQMCGGTGRTFVCDVADRQAVRELAASVRAIEGSCHVLVNNAGIGARTAFDGPAAIDALERVLAVNLVGPAACTAELLDLLTESAPATVINVSSVAGLYGVPGAPIYCASKFGLTGLSESLHASLSRQGIRVCSVHPGPVPTEGFPQEWLRSRWWTRPARADAAGVAAAIVRLADRGGPARRVIPRPYALGMVAKSITPGAYAWLLRRAARVRMEELPAEQARP